jgi:cytochrome oxidase Cu insertion factor (SCO1/SenC/PrrC family)
MSRFARAPMQLLAILVLACAWCAGPRPTLAANPISPRDVTTGIGGPFSLLDQDSQTVTDAQFRGKWLLVYFGYTHCPDACPTALNDMAEALDQLDPAKRQKVQVLFITVDPQRDTPAVMKEYVGAFEGANIIGLTGTPEQVTVAEAAYRIRARRYDRADGDYAMSHAATIDIMDPEGHFVAMAYPERIAERLAQLLP